jgi:Uma2 family endonuclease
MSTAGPTSLMTAEEFYDFCHRPENRDRRFELERGVVVESELSGIQHGVVCSNVGWILSNYTHRRRHGYACCNTGVIWERAPDTVKGPDVIFFDDNRRFDELATKYPERPPQLIVEVRSLNDREAKLIRRIESFLRRGVSAAWVVDSEGRTVTVYRLNQFPQVFDDTEALVGGDEMPDFRCPVAEFFAMPGE